MLSRFETENDYFDAKLFKSLFNGNYIEHESNFTKKERFVTFSLPWQNLSLYVFFSK